MATAEVTIPTEVWTSTPEQETEFDEAIKLARHEMNQKDSRQLIDELTRKVEQGDNGVRFAILNGSGAETLEYSDEEALVVFNAYAQAATPNQLVRAEFLREVAKFANVRDADGKLKPVVMLASPGAIKGSGFKLSKEDRSKVKQGDLGPAAKELLKVVSGKDIGKVSLFGFSQGADLALAGAAESSSADLDKDVVAVGDPAGVADRSYLGLKGDFLKAGSKDLKAAVGMTSLTAQAKAINLSDFMKFGASQLVPMNWALEKGLGKNSFENRVQVILDEGMVDKLVVAYGGDSAIASPALIEPELSRLYQKNGRDSFMSVRVDGAKHTWGDQMSLLYKLYLKALA